MFQENEPLAKHSNYKIGGPARYFLLAENPHQIHDAVSIAKKHNLKILILGGGTNILFSDAGFDGLVIKPNLKSIRREGNPRAMGSVRTSLVRVGAGATVEELLNF